MNTTQSYRLHSMARHRATTGRIRAFVIGAFICELLHRMFA